MIGRYLLGAFALVFLIGCATERSAEGSYMSDVTSDRALTGADYRRRIAYQGLDRSPVVVVHGFLGARLKNISNDKNVWGEVRVSEAISSRGEEFLQDLALPMSFGRPLDLLHDNVVADGLLTEFKVRVALFEFEVAGYAKLIKILEEAGYQREGGAYRINAPYPTLFVFDYDWRRDITENAIALGHFLRKKKAKLAHAYNLFYGKRDYDIKFNVIGHSMGGLVARYFMEYGDQKLNPTGPLPKLNWQGTKLIEQLIQIGTPNGGYVDTCVELVNGLKYATAAAPFPQGIIGTFHSYYQMMPHPAYGAIRDAGKVVDIYDIASWERYKWGLLAEEQDQYLRMLLPKVVDRDERYRIARDHLEKCLNKAKQFALAMTKYAEPPKGVKLRLFLGDSVNTSAQANVNHERKRLDVVKYDTGDGKVLAASARANLRELGVSATPYDVSPVDWSSVVHLPGAHMGIIHSNVFKDNLTYYLLASPQKRDIKTIKWRLEQFK